jgi:hypothetical protein
MMGKLCCPTSRAWYVHTVLSWKEAIMSVSKLFFQAAEPQWEKKRATTVRSRDKFAMNRIFRQLSGM